MKLALKILNLVIIALSVVATVFLFTSPVISFNSNIGLDVAKISEFVPETEYTKDINIVRLLGTDTIHVRIKFNVNMADANKVSNGDRDKINESFIDNNVQDIVNTMHEPVELIADFSIRSIIKSTVKAEIVKQVDAAKEKYGSEASTEDILEEVGLDDAYFTNFSYALYDAANASDATVDSVGDVLTAQIDDALNKAAKSGLVDISSYTAEAKEQVVDNLFVILDDLELVNEDNSLKPIGKIAYMYFSNWLKDELSGKVDASELEKGISEDEKAYSDRLMGLYVRTEMPQQFYDVIAITFYGLLVGLFIFAGIWLFLAIFTLYRTLFKKNKPWTIFGPWFWVVGSLQLVLGLGLTVFGKFVLPSLHLNLGQIPINSFIMAPRTYALIPSLIFLASIVLAIVYGFIKRAVKTLN